MALEIGTLAAGHEWKRERGGGLSEIYYLKREVKRRTFGGTRRWAGDREEIILRGSSVVWR